MNFDNLTKNIFDVCSNIKMLLLTSNLKTK